MSVLTAAVIFAGFATFGVGLWILFGALVLAFGSLAWYWAREVGRPLLLHRTRQNPILAPIAEHAWENAAVFNPAAVYANGRVHLFYRAMGHDGISRIGYASSADGIHFDERLAEPAYSPTRGFGDNQIFGHASREEFGPNNPEIFSLPAPEKRWGPLSYDTVQYASGGGWGGAEDPRIVIIDNTAVMTFVAFDGWGFVRMAMTQLALPDLLSHNWKWQRPKLMSKPNEINKNWVFFPEKIHGKYALLHTISPLF
jgi:hypothetical protein